MALNQVDYGDKALRVRSLEVIEDVTGGAITSLQTKIESVQGSAQSTKVQFAGFLSDIASDNRLTVVEKQELARRFADIQTEQPTTVQRALDAGIPQSNQYLVAYSDSYNNLHSFLYTDPAPLANMTSTDEIVGSQLMSLWTAYISAKVELDKYREEFVTGAIRNEISARAKFFYGETIPVGPYEVGDFWVSNDVLFISTAARAEGESNIDDWEWYIRPNLLMVVESSNGDVFKPGQSMVTQLIAHVFKNGQEITSTLSETRFRWRRVSYFPQTPPNDDATWNSNHTSGYKVIDITADDVTARATYHCDLME